MSISQCKIHIVHLQEFPKPWKLQYCSKAQVQRLPWDLRQTLTCESLWKSRSKLYASKTQWHQVKFPFQQGRVGLERIWPKWDQNPPRQTLNTVAPHPVPGVHWGKKELGSCTSIALGLFWSVYSIPEQAVCIHDISNFLGSPLQLCFIFTALHITWSGAAYRIFDSAMYEWAS